MKAVIRDRGRNYITPTVTAVGTTETEFTLMIPSTITARFFEILLWTTSKAEGSQRVEQVERQSEDASGSSARFVHVYVESSAGIKLAVDPVETASREACLEQVWVRRAIHQPQFKAARFRDPHHVSAIVGECDCWRRS